jgi:phosphoribosylamine--glycine ligase
MKVLVVGGGGREHALVWKLARSPKVDVVFSAPGNAGTASDGTNVNIADSDLDGLLAFAQKESIGLTVVGPEAPLTAGIVDRFAEAGLRAFGPDAAAAELEGSKVFAKQVMKKNDVPTAESRIFGGPAEAIAYIEAHEEPLVVKADGLAAGKGAIVCQCQHEAVDAVNLIMKERAFGDAGNRVVIEERLEGEEASILVLTDGRTICPLETSQDHKQVYDGDQGPNTGGMGAYSPAPVITEVLDRQIQADIIVPTIHGMKRARRPFKGLLYAGLMLTPAGPKVLEFNVRFGDPEAQPLLMRLKSDLVDVIEAVIDGNLRDVTMEWDPRPAVCVVMAAPGYPSSYPKGLPIDGLEAAAELDDVKVFHAGTKLEGGKPVTSGGRVLGVTALGDTIAAAKARAYEAVKLIRFPGAHCRTDISDKALKYQMNG